MNERKVMISSENIEKLTELADMDHWQHSWHNNMSEADDEKLNAKLKIILQDKITKRQQEIKALKIGLEILNNMELKKYEQIYKAKEYNDDLPF